MAFVNEQLANLIRDFNTRLLRNARRAQRLYRACGYKRGVAGPNPIAKWRRHLKILELAALWQQALGPQAFRERVYGQVQRPYKA